MPADAAGAPPLLEVDGLSVRYGGALALDHVSLRVAGGRVVGLIGPNGAGKTSLVDAVCGFVPSRGEVRLDGRPLAGSAPHARARRGLARTWQSVELFGDLTVVENLLVSARRVTWRSMVADLVRPGRARADAHVEAALAATGLAPFRDTAASELSLGRQKAVGLARALAGGPTVLLLDEPAAGLDAAESRDLGVVLRRLSGQGLGILLIDHDLDLVLDVCDEVVVLDVGRVIARGAPHDVRADSSVIAAYVGAGRP